MARTPLNSFGITITVMGAVLMFASYLLTTYAFVDPYLENRCDVNCTDQLPAGVSTEDRSGHFTRFGCECRNKAQESLLEFGYFFSESEFWDDIAVSAVRALVLALHLLVFGLVVGRIVVARGTKDDSR